MGFGWLFGRRHLVLKAGLALLAVLGVLAAVTAWQRISRALPQPRWIAEGDGTTRFFYRSLGGERDAGIPYWIFYVLPSMFPDKLPGPGGYASLGLPWQEGKELPVGLVKSVIGYPRVGINCALCHTARFRLAPDGEPVFVPAGPGHTGNAEGLFRFLAECAKDPRFNSDALLTEIQTWQKLDWIDRLLYRFFVIPGAKRLLIERGEHFAWAYRRQAPAWGRGRDAPRNHGAFFTVWLAPGDTFGSTQTPAAWNLGKYASKPGQPDGQRLNAAGDTPDARSVIVDSLLGLLGAPPRDRAAFDADVAWLEGYLKDARAPKFPVAGAPPRLARSAAAGQAVFARQCAACHGEDSAKVGRPLPPGEIGTDEEALRRWSRAAAEQANREARALGIERAGFVEADPVGYTSPHLDGIWLRGPYLHNGSVPTLWDLLQPAKKRPPVFYRGYDVLDPVKVGFDSLSERAEQGGTRFDTSRPGNGNQGHEFGASLSDDEKWALIEYLKTL